MGDGPYRAPSPPERRVLRSRRRVKAFICRLFGHRRWELFHLSQRPWLCLRCGVIDLDGLTVAEMDACVRRSIRWLDLHAGTRGT